LIAVVVVLVFGVGRARELRDTLRNSDVAVAIATVAAIAFMVLWAVVVAKSLRSRRKKG
jgi:hypothetical protein